MGAVGTAAMQFWLGLAAILLLVAPRTAALDNGLGQLPIMGWSTWNLFGCWGTNWTEVDIRQMADALVSSGMADAGYSYINLDGGWLGGRDPATGAPYPNAAMFPSGIPALVDYVHNKGLRFGIYRDRHEGLGHEEIDAKQYAAWKCDYVKNDGYGNSSQSYSHGQTATQVYADFRDAVNATGRPMALNIKFDVEPEGFASAFEIANSYRIGRDVRPVWADVVRLADIAEPLSHYGHPGSFPDLDSLEVGVPAPIYVESSTGQPSGTCSNFCPGNSVQTGECVAAEPARNVTMSTAEQKTMMAIWCMSNSMLIAGNDLRTMTQQTLDILTAPGPLSILNDPLSIGAQRLRLEPAGLFEVWARPLDQGMFAAMLWSRNESCLANDDSRVHLDPTPQVFWRSLGFRGKAEVIDFWTGEHLGTHADNWPTAYSSPLSWGLTPHAHRLIKVVPASDVEWLGQQGEQRTWMCPKWGCAIHSTVRQHWEARVKTARAT